ncbi:hypothetical protein EDL98_03770 [Ornithobacterium rhinotracheale]|uniref:hypothetical protein n=1 Tax=Ornithobacterium rhinotracheale TaxID=28251 RepID=UPI00129C6D51|nr:hypothetical protein [Ornithobacterium rhinotracheale]MRJ08449.1 hypothetical protein [Ornithobacterium rhinotracheale]MRJ10195.1 hypothetical protein [Ornithobacterium rhinotracheale]UOH76725.1 hypothetical protein MT996_05710 [Ornithobacterium rhinotracheale]
MLDIELNKVTFQKKYLQGVNCYEFNSLLDLIFELFQANKIEETETSDIIYEYIKSIGYDNISNIPKDELKIIESYYWDLKKINKIDYEKVFYSFLAQILNGNVLVLIDKKIIKTINNPISINSNSIISFLLKPKFENIKFKTL